jgi:hypothetical protein
MHSLSGAGGMHPRLSQMALPQLVPQPVTETLPLTATTAFGCCGEDLWRLGNSAGILVTLSPS